ncbi:hypothetical protein BJX66DRAFT_305673 [Aspergillus keveii]|uniref:BTB domain-containing protein n=1 Tax=Aspergillus keveii TaxID=714993 RepID=A0ABR4G3R6_9EURO
MPTKASVPITPSEMVSQAQVLDRSLPPQSAPSSASRHSHSSRRHRSSRSHHGGLIHQPQNDFPVFTHTGDVELVIRAGRQENRYLLHRLILAQCSGFFETSTQEEWSRQARWRFELDWENKGEDEEPILVQKPPSISGAITSEFGPYAPPITKPSSTHTGFARSMANLAGLQSVIHLPHRSSAVAAAAANTHTANERTMDPILRDYDNLFRLFYNHPPMLNNINIATAYAECKSLLALADMYDALPVTGPRVDHHLLGFGSRLFKQIAKYPPSYLKLGYLARSRVIFSEALIHVVGQWPAGQPHLRSGPYSPLPPVVLDIIEDKFEDLEDLKARIDSKLLRLTLTTSRGERVSPQNAYLDWLAISLFRQWLVDSTTPPPPSILKNNSHSADRAHTTRAVSTATPSTPSAPRPTNPASTATTAVSSASVYRLIGPSNTIVGVALHARSAQALRAQNGRNQTAGP